MLSRRSVLQLFLVGPAADGTKYLIPSAQNPPKRTLQINLEALDHIEVLGPNGAIKRIETKEIWDALQ